MLAIYSGTSFLTFYQISGLKEAFEKIIKYQTALKFEFRSMHLIGQKIFTILRMLIFSATEICAELCCAANLLGDIFLNYLPSLSLGRSI